VRRDRMTRQAKMAKGHPKGLGRGNLKEEVNSQGLQGATSFKDLSDTTTGGDASRPHLFICVSPRPLPDSQLLASAQRLLTRTFPTRCLSKNTYERGATMAPFSVFSSANKIISRERTAAGAPCCAGTRRSTYRYCGSAAARWRRPPDHPPSYVPIHR